MSFQSLLILGLCICTTLTNCSVMFPDVPSAILMGKGDDNVFHYQIKNRFPLFKSPKNRIYVSTNGYVSFDTSIRTRNWNWPYIKRKVKNAIGIYSFDLVNLDSNSNMTYSEVSQNTIGYEKLFQAIDKEISKRRLSFKTKFAIVVSYHDIQVYNQNFRHLRYSFQVVFASDGKDTYGIFNYDKTPRMNIGSNNYYATTGFYEPGNECTDRQNIFEDDTVSYRLSELSNVGVTGRYVHSLTRCQFKNHCNPTPCLNEGECMNYEDGYVCECKIGNSGKNCEIAPAAGTSKIQSKSMYHSMKPSKSMYHSMKPSKSMYHSMKPSKSMYHSMKPSKSMYHSMKPSKSMYHSIQPSKSMYYSMKPSKSMYHSMKPSKSMYHSMKPSKSMYHSMKPSKSMYQSMKPSKSMYHSMKPSKSMYHSMKPSRSMFHSMEPSQVMTTKTPSAMSSKVISMSAMSFSMRSRIIPSSSASATLTASVTSVPISPDDFQPFGKSVGDLEIEMDEHKIVPVKDLGGDLSGNYTLMSTGNIATPIGMIINPNGSIETGGNIFFRIERDMERLKSINRAIDQWRSNANRISRRSVKTSSYSANVTTAIIITYNVTLNRLSGLVNFQLTLAGERENLILIVNMKKVKSSFKILFRDCELDQKVIFQTDNAANEITNIGYPGIWVHKLECEKKKPTETPTTTWRPNTTPSFKNSTGIRAMKLKAGSFTFVKVKMHQLPMVCTEKVTAIFTELVTKKETPIHTFISRPKTGMSMGQTINYNHNVLNTYLGYSNLTLNQSLLLIMKYTNQTRYFQYGEEKFPMISSQQYCRRVKFKVEMENKPTIKLQAHAVPLSQNYAVDFVNVWLRNVTQRGFTFCVQELISFIGEREGSIAYMAIAGPVDKYTKRHTIIKKIGQSTCRKIMFNQRYLEEPFVFVSAEESLNSYSKAPLIAWVKDVDESYAEVCGKSTTSDMHSNHTEMLIHVIVRRDYNPCVNHTCPTHLQCKVDSMKQPYCGCISHCSNDSRMICGSDGMTYKSMCQVHKEHCKKYGSASKSNITLKYQGKCIGKPMESGIIELEPVKKRPGAFCKYVNLTEFKFYSGNQLNVFLTVSWGKHNMSKDMSKLNDASASWSEEVTAKGFKACVMVAGRHMFEDFTKYPMVYWLVMTKSPQFGIDLGYRTFGTWYTGSRCERIANEKLENMRGEFVLLASVEHTKKNNFQNAMTVWTERRVYNGFNYFYLCARELQNFDGIHEGVKVHYMIARQSNLKAFYPSISETTEVTFESKYIFMGKGLPPMCKTIKYNFEYPSLPRPNIIAGVKTSKYNIDYKESGQITLSDNDAVAWIEHIDNSSLTVCLKSIRASTSYSTEYRVSLIVLPNFCEPGTTYFDGSCYRHYGNKAVSYSIAKTMCSNAGEGYKMLTIETARESWYLMDKTMPSAWIDFKRDLQSNNKWTSSSGSNYTNWLQNKTESNPLLNNAVVVSTSDIYGWKAEKSDNAHKVICEKKLNKPERSCKHYCMNGGVCKQPGPMQMCECPKGFLGKRCEFSVHLVSPCSNYTDLSHETWRSTNNSMKQSNNTSCDAKMLKNGWFRFAGRLYDHCPNQKPACGTLNPGWVSGSHPRHGEKVYRNLHYNSRYCAGATDQGRVEIQHCGDFFVYKFNWIPDWSCDYGICTM